MSEALPLFNATSAFMMNIPENMPKDESIIPNPVDMTQQAVNTIILAINNPRVRLRKASPNTPLDLPQNQKKTRYDYGALKQFLWGSTSSSDSVSNLSLPPPIPNLLSNEFFNKIDNSSNSASLGNSVF